jgi:Protein-tyrosine phosphatase
VDIMADSRRSGVPGYRDAVTTTRMPGGAGVLPLPSGRLVRGRGLREPDPDGPDPEFALYVVASELFGGPWEFRWVEWADYGLPADPAAMRRALVEAWERDGRERVEVGCMGGRGRTGTALACIAVLDGVPADQAVEYVSGTITRTRSRPKSNASSSPGSPDRAVGGPVGRAGLGGGVAPAMECREEG